MNIHDFQDKHEGERCFIACNGPSLNEIPMEKLQGEIIFGLNRGYLKEGLPIKYLVVMVGRVAKQWGDEILKVSADVIFTNHLLHPKVCTYPLGNRVFQPDLHYPMKRGHTVTFLTMQIAFGMGFKEVYLIGCDHSFDYRNTKKDETHYRAVITTGDDPNHFDPNYFGEGASWLPYSPKMVEGNYKEALQVYRQNGRTLLNLSATTRLPERIIPRGRFEDFV